MGHSHAFRHNPAFNPYNYQTGSVWPHDNAIIAMGFSTMFRREAAVSRTYQVAASYFGSINCRSCTPRSSARNQLPVQYIGANVRKPGCRLDLLLTQALLGFSA